MKNKLKNPTCIAIVITAMVLAIIFSGIAIFLLPGLTDQAPEDGQGFKLEDLFNVGNLGSGDFGGGGGLDLSGSIGLGSGGGNGGSGGDSLAYEVYASEEENIYLRIKSFGDYTGRSWSEATTYTEYFSVSQGGREFSGNYLTGFLLSETGSSSMYISIKPHTDQYAIPYYTGVSSVDNYDIQLNDVVTEGKVPEQYNMYFYSGDPARAETFQELSKYMNVRDFERRYYRYVKDNYLYVDKETKAFMLNKINEIGIDGEIYDIIEQVSEYISSAAVYNLDYDRTLDTEENIAVAFLV